MKTIDKFEKCGVYYFTPAICEGRERQERQILATAIGRDGDDTIFAVVGETFRASIEVIGEAEFAKASTPYGVYTSSARITADVDVASRVLAAIHAGKQFTSEQ